MARHIPSCLLSADWKFVAFIIRSRLYPYPNSIWRDTYRNCRYEAICSLLTVFYGRLSIFPIRIWPNRHITCHFFGHINFCQTYIWHTRLMSEMYYMQPTFHTCVCFFLICLLFWLVVYRTYTTYVCLVMHVSNQPDTYRAIAINKLSFARRISVLLETGAVSGQTSRH